MLEPHQGVSVVLPCHNRGSYLAHWLAAFAWWHPHDFAVEIIVVDDGGSDAAADVVDHWNTRGLDVRYVRLRPGGAPRNNAVARNAGIRAARLPLVLNSDPDVLFATDVVERLVAAWRPGTFCSPAQYLPLTRSATLRLWRVSEHRPLTASDLLDAARGRQNLVHRPDGVYGLHGAFLCDAATLTRLRGYDERFTCWGWEDQDLLTRVNQGLGLERRYVEGSVVVHQWHPDLRADEGPARSRVLWQMGWQRSCATTPASVERNEAGWGEPTTAGADEEKRARAHVTPPDRDSCSHFFDAYLYESQVWRREGQPEVAIERLRLALGRWWEAGDTEMTDPRPVEVQVRLAHDAGYAYVAEAAIEYARAAAEAGQSAEADKMLRAAACLPGTAPAVLSLRARWLLHEGHVETAASLLEASIATGATVEALALLIEVSLRLGRGDRASSVLDSALLLADVDAFDRLLLDCYLARLSPASATPRAWPPLVQGDSAGDFLFSVAMRARRAGLMYGAMSAFDAYLALDEGFEDDLRERARHLRDETAVEWERLVGESKASAAGGEP